MKLIIFAAALFLSLGISALAGSPTPTPVHAAPGPLLGAGLPVLAVGLGRVLGSEPAPTAA
jgi:hypothetical protein